MTIAIILPIIAAIFVKYAVDGESPRDTKCPPHSWSYVHMSDKIVCIQCGKESHINPFI